MILPIFLPNAGCKKRCVFCNQYSMTGEKMPSKKEILNTIQKYSNFSIDEVAFYGGTFTGLSLEKQLEFLELVKYLNVPIRISTRPDEITEENLGILERYNVKTIEIGIQSMFNDVLDASNRGHTVEDNERSIHLLMERNFKVSAHLMIGLPKDSKEKSILSLMKLLKLGVNIFRIHPTLIFKNTELEKMYEKNLYTPLTLKEALDISSEMLLLIYSNNANVIRMGYFVPEHSKNQIVAGPYHPSFGDMVKAKAIYKIITRLNIRKVHFPKKYESWFFSYGNKQLNVEKIRDNVLLFDDIDLARASFYAFRKGQFNG
ncbi:MULTISPECIES: radical SAM protein [unclassified Thermosipho (in: thermotogales)]|uniref:elongator complex protein 3 n=1 Tax=unclassified Thermosipho (in: thermotogales) TaxID=2676525 RepID=UPI00098727C9|nr:MULTISPECIES: radical SAM protein [unclassified Thermosipho (in: thermotogales)]MBT1248248.1 radical SAM protein [Thermosipho sp. 1244]OOC46506.1 radical SAM protein [Thermosipho sp. 1223]